MTIPDDLAKKNRDKAPPPSDLELRIEQALQLGRDQDTITHANLGHAFLNPAPSLVSLSVADPPSSLPVVSIFRDSGTIVFNDKTYEEVDVEACRLLRELLDKHPERIGLTNDDRQKPDRVIKKLPKAIRAIIDTNNKGSILKL